MGYKNYIISKYAKLNYTPIYYVGGDINDWFGSLDDAKIAIDASEDDDTINED